MLALSATVEPENKLGNRSQISGGEVAEHLLDPGLNVRGIVPLTPAASAEVSPTMEAANPVSPTADTASAVAATSVVSVAPPKRLGEGQFSQWLPQHLAMAKAAWRYFEKQYQPQTGLVNSVAGYREATLWDVASVLAGNLAALEFELITPAQFSRRTDTLLTTLIELALYDERLPNRSYHTDSGKPVVSNLSKVRNGNGWSALDIARTLGWLHILQQRQPQYAPQVAKIRARWHTQELVNGGELQGARYYSKSGERRYQEGRIGYEQYAALALSLWGLTPNKALHRQASKRVSVAGVSLPVDIRPRPFLTSDPFYLAMLEFGQQAQPLRFETEAIYLAQKQHYLASGEIHCFGEDAISWPPWFLYNNLHFFEHGWHSTDYRGSSSKQSQPLSAKCAVAFGVLGSDEFATALWQQASQLYRDKGWYSGVMADGRVNTSSNLNTNAVILTALLYVHNGNRGLLLPPLTATAALAQQPATVD